LQQVDTSVIGGEENGHRWLQNAEPKCLTPGHDVNTKVFRSPDYTPR